MLCFVEALLRAGRRLVPAAEARAFAVERLPHARPCGLHKAYAYLPPQQLEELLRAVELEYQSCATAPQGDER
jgi:hypothetical protein